MITSFQGSELQLLGHISRETRGWGTLNSDRAGYAMGEIRGILLLQSRTPDQLHHWPNSIRRPRLF